MKTFEFKIPNKTKMPPIWNKCYVPYMDTIDCNSFKTLESMYCRALSKQVLVDLIDSLNLNINKSQSSCKIAKEISARLMIPASFKNFLYSLSDDSLDIFKDIVNSESAYLLPANKAQQNLILLSSGYLCLNESTTLRVVVVPENVKALFRETYSEDFAEKRNQIRWLSQCLQACTIFHGVTPSETVAQIFNQDERWNYTAEEIMSLSKELPYQLRYSKLVENDFVAFSFIRNNSSYDIIGSQAGKDYYIPSVDDIKKICTGTYWGSSQYANQVIEFLIKEIPENKICRHISDAVREVEISFASGSTLSEAIDILLYFEIILPSSALGFRKLEKNLLHLWSNTRMPVNRGHTPLELEGKKVVDFKIKHV